MIWKSKNKRGTDDSSNNHPGDSIWTRFARWFRGGLVFSRPKTKERRGVMDQASPTERSKLVLELCAYELKHLSRGALMTLEFAITGQIEDAVRASLQSIEKIVSQGSQATLIRVRKSRAP